ncbi:hypothetical protein TVAG_201960 [Trichomonas vaginalis G3]|uniref:Fringe-like glycosyltransferase domain-containing protein n=1 Tax=Trichomonas vaginalis (strain ATCC PRA-98 / G3) TaxID=412133 RepID=A2DWL7_TRIV3|nr:hypothetical protein TVAGG3_0201810 [Trichomonas vaginalis G3]EAY15202.1 hypothetical protein TVAG_201960 [Trichomonas vaginalis G3]KAI5550644.1 hypothetical protein TVAGG3_0201810 [Trichomonas vaginalis G3]|eukprot:XP_001327425.1 hypothetical protein [Trichomonas vaginalis G3]
MFVHANISSPIRKSFILAAFILIVLYIFHAICATQISEYIPQIQSQPYIQNSDKCKLYMFLLNGNPQNMIRVKVGYEYWARDFAKMFKNSMLRVGSALDLDVELDYQYNIPWNGSIIHFQNFLHMFIQSLYDFYYSTDLDWYARTTDDCLVDIRKLPQMMSELESEYDPRKDIVVKGHLIQSPVIVKGRNFAYLHGGSGWIMSRAAVHEFLLHEKEYVDEYYSEYAKGDDVITFQMMNKMHLKPNQINSYRFLGPPLLDESVDNLEYKWYENIKVCSDHSLSYLNPNTYLKDVVFWHAGRNDMVTTRKGFRYLSEIPSELKVQFAKEKGTICFLQQNPFINKTSN